MSTTERLRGLRLGLDGLGDLPLQLRTFHNRRLVILGEVEDLAGRVAWLVRSRDLHALETQVASLETLARDLTLLSDDVERLRQRLVALGEKAVGLRDGPVGTWFQARAKAVGEVLAGIGEGTGTAEAINAERRRLKAVLDDLPGLERALDLYQEAEGWLQRLQAEVRKAELSADLPGLGRRLLAEGVGPDWIGALERLIEPLRAFANRREPPEIKDLGGRIQGLLEWRSVLDVPCPRCDWLAQDHRRKVQDWAVQDDDAFQVLSDTTLTLELELVGLAQERLRSWLAEIESHKTLLRELGERDAELEGLHERLKGATPENATAFAAWRDAFTRAQQHFHGIVSIRSQDIEERYDQIAKTCRVQLAQLAERPHLDAAGRRLRDLTAELSRLEHIPDGEEPLRGIGALRDLGARVDALGLDMELDLKWLRTNRAALEARRAPLADLAQRLGYTLPPALSQPTSPPPDRPVPIRLEQAQADDETLVQALAAAETALLATSQVRLDAWRTRVADILALAPGSEEPGDTFPAAPVAMSEVAPALDRAEAQLAEAEARLDGALTHLRDQRESLLARSAEIEMGRLGPLQARQIEQRRQFLAQWVQSTEADPLNQARTLHELVLAMRVVLQPIEQARQHVRTLRRGLSERLQRLNLCNPIPQFPEACQEWAERIEALIAPTDTVRRPIEAETAQLELAARLLDALEVHCRRLAAAQDAADIARLRDLSRRPVDPDAQALLARLAALPRHQPPPALLRLELQDLIAARMETRNYGH